MKKIYIAGPMRGMPDFNYPTFDYWAKLHRNVGWDVMNPTEIGAAFGTPDEINADPALLERVMKAERRALTQCDAIFLLKGWEKSRGARKELALAIDFDCEIHLAPEIAIPLICKSPEALS